jgi:hypothetical protein
MTMLALGELAPDQRSYRVATTGLKPLSKAFEVSTAVILGDE